MAPAKGLLLVLQWLEAIVHTTTWMSDSYTIYNNYPHLLSMKNPETLVTSMAEFGLAAAPL
jgi:hypothetical protein